MTNADVIARLNSWDGPIQGWLPTPSGLRLVRLRKQSVHSVLVEAGRQSPARSSFVVRGGIAYIARPGDPVPPLRRKGQNVNNSNINSMEETLTTIQQTRSVEFEIGYMSATMSHAEVAEMLADRPDLMATYRRITGQEQAERLRAAPGNARIFTA